MADIIVPATSTTLANNLAGGGASQVVYQSAANTSAFLTAGSEGQILRLGASGAPAYSTSTWPATNAINTIPYASSANVMGSIAAANSSVLVTSGAGVPSLSTTLPDGLTGGSMTMGEAKNIALGTTTGTKIGTATTQKLGFWNATPVVQPVLIADPAGGATVDAEARTAVNAILDLLISIGAMAAA